MYPATVIVQTMTVRGFDVLSLNHNFSFLLLTFAFHEILSLFVC